MCDTQAKTGPKPIAEIVREKTNDGELIVDFLIDVMLRASSKTPRTGTAWKPHANSRNSESKSHKPS